MKTDDDARIAWMCGLVVLALAAWSAWQRWEVLSATPWPVGVDGWYYPLQLRALLERGELAYPAAPLTFWLMAPIAALLDDPIAAAKLVAAVGGALVALPAYARGRRAGGLAGGLVAAVLAVSGGGSFFLSLEFVKNGLGLTVGLTAVWLGLRALEAPGRGRIAAAALGLIATALTHKMGVLLALALLVPAAIVELRHRGIAARRVRPLLAGAGAVMALVLVAGVLAPQRFAGPADLRLLEGAVSGPLEWQLPALAVDQGKGGTYRLWLGHQGLIAAASAAALLLAVGLARLAGGRVARRHGQRGASADQPRPADAAMLWSAFALVAVGAWPALDVADPDALGFRLRVASFAPGAIVAAAAAGRLLGVLGGEWRLIAATALSLVWLAVRDPRPTEGMVDTEVPMVSACVALRGVLPPDAVVITAERHLGFQVAWFARVPVRLRPEPVPHARRYRMIALGMIGFNSPLDQALRAARAQPQLAPPIGLHPGHPNGLVIIPEATWDWVLTQLPPRSQAWWRRWHTR
jgi:hypothetical protein